MTERKLASIRRIADIRPIEGADNIVCAVVDGWELVTQKSNGFKKGDLVAYFEIDSVLPEREEFEFLRDRCYVSEKNSVNGAGFRLKTIKLRGQVSQGLILPLSSLFSKAVDPDTFEPHYILYGSIEGTLISGGVSIGDGIDFFVEGQDLTEILGVVKYEKPLPAQLAGVARGNFPSFIRKTDQERIQNCFKYLKRDWINHRWEVTVKLDGSSMTVYYRTHPDLSEGQFGVCSRNLDLQETEGNSFWQAARNNDLESKLKPLGRSLAIQGELVGPGIQGNKDELANIDFYVFDIFDIEKQTYLAARDRSDITKALGLKHVPVLSSSMSLDDNITIEQIKEMADGPSLNPKKNREGLVFKSLTDPNVSWKIISDKWLLKND